MSSSPLTQGDSSRWCAKCGNGTVLLHTVGQKPYTLSSHRRATLDLMVEGYVTEFYTWERIFISISSLYPGEVGTTFTREISSDRLTSCPGEDESHLSAKRYDKMRLAVTFSTSWLEKTVFKNFFLFLFVKLTFGFFDVSDSCMPYSRLNETCFSDDDCSLILNERCVNGKCVCPINTVYDPTRFMCVNPQIGVWTFFLFCFLFILFIICV